MTDPTPIRTTVDFRLLQRLSALVNVPTRDPDKVLAAVLVRLESSPSPSPSVCTDLPHSFFIPRE